jgi:hypothetical protein
MDFNLILDLKYKLLFGKILSKWAASASRLNFRLNKNLRVLIRT